jgi:hypothetical protein
MRPALRLILFGRAQEAYLLRDDFSDTLAAGAVNGTLAVPGPGGNRIVNDTGNRLSLSGGRVQITTGAAAYGDPGIRYPTLTRTHGFSLWTQGKLSNDTLGMFGFTRFDVLTELAAGIMINTGVLKFGQNYTTVGTHATNYTYNFGVVLRTVGSCIFVKGNTYVDWTLLWVDKTVRSNNLRPAIDSHTLVGYFEQIRRPARMITVSPLCADSFNREDGAIGVTDGVEAEETGGAGQAWIAQLGTFGVDTNKAKSSALDVGTGYAVATVNVGTPNAMVEATAVQTAGVVGLVAWWTDVDNYLRIIHNGTNLQLISRIAGVEATLVNAAATIGRIVLSTDGTKVRCYSNNVLIGTEQTVSTLTPTNVYGLFTSDLGNTLDAFTVWNRKGGAYAAFDRFF